MGTQKPERPVPVPRLPGKYRQSTAPRNGAPPRPRRPTNRGLLAVPQNDTKTEQNYHGCKLQPEPTRATAPQARGTPHRVRRAPANRTGTDSEVRLHRPAHTSRSPGRSEAQTKESSRDPREPGWAGVGPIHARCPQPSSQDTWCALGSRGTTQPGPPDPRRSL